MSIKEYVTVPNVLSASRILFLPLLFAFAMLRYDLAFVIAYALIGATDFFDGLLARRLDQRSEFGKNLDAFADLPFYLISAFFLARLHMQYLKPNLLFLYIFFGILGLSLVLSILRCRKPMILHTYLGKLASVLVYLLVILSAFVDTTILVTVILAIFTLKFIEDILIFLIHGEVDMDTKSIFQVRPKPTKG